MEADTTGALGAELMSTPDLDTYLTAHQASFASQDGTEALMDLYHRSRMTKADLARKAGMSDVYLHQVLSGRRTLSRDRLLSLCSAAELSLEETQRLLKRLGYAQLYPRNRRDAILIYGLLHGMTPNEINDKLFAENEKALF